MESKRADKSFIFLAGHHRSGTSLLHEIIREHSSVSGFSKTGVPEDEGQHLQSVYEPAKTYGGPGKYIFNQHAYMDENHALATEQSAKAILAQWEPHYDAGCAHYIEKSPPNLIRTRFLQKLFPNSRFVVLLRHPLAISCATQKWSKTTIPSLVEHTLKGYEIFMQDMPYLNNVYVLRYEDFVARPQMEIDKVYAFLGLPSIPVRHKIVPDVNEKYFSMLQDNRTYLKKRILVQDVGGFGFQTGDIRRYFEDLKPGPNTQVGPKDFFEMGSSKSLLAEHRFHPGDGFEERANRIGYSFENYKELIPVSLLGAHHNQIQPSP